MKTTEGKRKTYLAQGICTNCGRRNYPQWGTYDIGVKLETYPCPDCGCKTWIVDKQALELNKKAKL